MTVLTKCRVREAISADRALAAGPNETTEGKSGSALLKLRRRRLQWSERIRAQHNPT